MIISASRRTDIPAFYTPWFINRIRAGYCAVPNPFRRDQVSYVSLNPTDVDIIVFWTRNPAPLLPHLAELDGAGFRYYIQYTLLDNPREIDPKSPPLTAAVDTFKKLSDCIGPERVIWRYDPIVFSKMTGAGFHKARYAEIARLLKGYTRRSVISIVDLYQKSSKRYKQLAQQGIEIEDYRGEPAAQFESLMKDMVQSARDSGLEIYSCAEEIDLTGYGILPGKCVDDNYIHAVFGLEVTAKKDPSQRKACGCVVSKDIGMYDSCVFGCQYCYATNSFDRARTNHEAHDPTSPSLIGWYDAVPPEDRS
jgi:predicted peroxiredoxin